jgi:hypothetical protein
MQHGEVGEAFVPHEQKRNAYRALMGKREGKRSLAGPKSRLDDDIKKDLQEKR